MTDRVHLGFEVGTGKTVSVPLHHAIVSGVTGLSGKTTAIEAMLSRLPEGHRSLVFSTKRGEIPFDGAHPVQPFYRATVDWEYVSGVLEAARKERLKFERSWIIKASRGAKSLRDVYKNIVAALEGGKPLRGLDESVWTTLRAYFEKVLPELESQPWAASLNLAPGVNVMHLEHLSEEVQGLVIAASLEEAHRVMSNVVLVIPEAWAYVPQHRGSPVKWAAQHIIRQGRARGVYLWLDSQDVTGVSKDVLKSVDLWCLGRQREINEVKRVLAQLPSMEKPRPSDIMTLGIGQFYVSAEDEVRLVYVQPRWLDDDRAHQVAMGSLKTSELTPPLPSAENSIPHLASRTVSENPKLSSISTVEEDPMVIAELREQLARVELERDEAKNHLGKKDEQVAKLQLELDQLRKQVQIWGRQIQVVTDLRAALADFLRPALSSESATAPDLDSLVETVAARLGVDHKHQGPSLEALRHRFQQEVVDRLYQQVQAMDERPRKAILWLLSVGRPAKHMEICRRLGFPEAGASFVKFGTGIKEAVARGFLISTPANGLDQVIRDKVVAELEPYHPAPDEVEATYQHLVAALADSANGRKD